FLENYLDHARLSILCRIVECFLGDAVEIRFNVLVERQISDADRVELRIDTGVTGPFFCIIRHRGNETGLIEHAGAKLPGEKADLAIDDLSKLGKSLDPFCDVRSFIAESRNTCDLQAKGGERLAKLVVKVAGDSPAFIFLDRKEPPQEI